MSYAGGTTHYDFPQIVSSDRPTFADFNEAFRTLDTKLFGLEGDASTTDGRLDTLEGKMSTAEGDIVDLKSADIRIEGKADANAEAITLLQGTVGTHTGQIATKADMVAIGDVYLTTQGYTQDDVVMYNGQRYVCTTTYTTGEPFDADKWTAVDVNTELAQLNSELANKANSSDLINIFNRASQRFPLVYLTDCDIITEGTNEFDIYAIDGNTANSPSGVSFALLIEYSYNTGYAVQYAFTNSGVRYRVYGGGTWTTWS